jgi:beta-galactosidase
MKLFNNQWLFAPKKLDFNAPDDAFEPITLPHTNKTFQHRNVDACEYQFVSTYRKNFQLPEDKANRRVFLDFDGVMLNGVVYLNQIMIGEHVGGFTNFSLDMTDALIVGQNVLTVYVDSIEHSSIPPFGNLVDYLVFGGIYRDVHLRLVDVHHIEDVFARPLDVLSQPRLECDIRLSQMPPESTVRGTLKDQDGVTIVSTEIDVESLAITLSFPELSEIELWTLHAPTLYQLEISLFQDQTLVDSVDTTIGFRDAIFDKDGRFYLNGEPLKLVGLNRHQTYPYIGAAAPSRLQQLDADLIKYELGCNIVRTSHYPQSPHFLNRCDEIGLLVFEEIPGWQHIGDDNWQNIVVCDVQAMIERDRNHPAIILWGVRVNESPDNDDLYRRTNALAHQLDPTRQTGGVRDRLNSTFLEDVYTYNDFSNDIRTPVHQPHLITEYSGHMLPTKTWDHEERRIKHALLHAHIQNLQLGRDDVAGAIGWCAFDYNTHREFGSGDRICHHGVMDMFRLPKWAAYFYQSQQPPAQKVVLQAISGWTMGDRGGGGSHPLTVLSNCDEIRMWIGEEYIGEFHPDFENYPHLQHPPFVIYWAKNDNPWGTSFDDLRLEGYIDDKMVVEQRIAADHIPCHLELLLDTPQLIADGADMTRVIVRVTDRYHNVLPYIIRVVTFSIDGGAELIGENPLSLIGGQAALFVKAGFESGTVQIKATATDLPTASISLDIVP